MIICVICVICGLASSAAALAGPRNLKPGDPVGDFQLKNLNGQVVDSKSWAGRPAIWIFISPQQTSSEQALVDLQQIVDDVPAAGVGAVALTGDAAHLQELREFAVRNRIRIPIVLDAGREIYGRFGIIVLPTTLVVNGQGRLHAAHPGHDLAYARAIRAHVQFMLGRIGEQELKEELAATQPARNPAREQADRLARSAAVMLRRGLLDEAGRELQRAIEADATYWRAYLDLAKVKLMQNDPATAESLVNRVLAANATDRDARLVLGMVRFRQNRLDDANRVLEEALLLNPDPAITNYWLGRVYEAAGDAERARQHYRAAAERLLPPDSGELARSSEPRP